LYTGLKLDYRLRLWAFTSASRAISAVAELLVTSSDRYFSSCLCRPRCWRWLYATRTAAKYSRKRNYMEKTASSPSQVVYASVLKRQKLKEIINYKHETHALALNLTQYECRFIKYRWGSRSTCQCYLLACQM